MKRLHSLLAILFLLPVGTVIAQNAPEAAYTLIPDEVGETLVTNTARVSMATELPLTLYSVNYQAEAGSPEEMARAYFRDRGADLGMKTGGQDMVLQAVREMPSGYRVRFTQEVGGIPVYRSGVAVVLDRNGAVRFVSNGYKADVNPVRVASKMGGKEAIESAKAYLEADVVLLQRESPVIYAPFGAGRLAHRVHMLTPRGGWEVLVDASTGEVFRSEPSTHIAEPGSGTAGYVHAGAGDDPVIGPVPTTVLSKNAQRVDGSGWVFDPDPLSTSGMAYGEVDELLDADDADSDLLTAQLKEVVLRDITLDGSTYSLTGPYVSVTEFDVPSYGSFEQESSTFHFTRSQPAFEAVNVYYHLDASMRYINETLGISLSPTYYEGGIVVDPHGMDGATNAVYIGDGWGYLMFGEGGVDSAEDAEVVLHELGHGIHDWITNGNLSRTHGLSEGSSDYWAASYSRSLGLWQEGSEEWNTFGRWGLKPFFAGRTLDYGGKYPFDLVGQVHTDGQMWSSAVMAVWNELGKDTTDRLFLEALSMLGPDSNTEDAARAIVLADTLLNGAANADLILDRMTDRGFIYRSAMAGLGRSGTPPLTVNFLDLSVFGTGSATAWQWDFESDGVVDLTSRSASHTYSEPGLYSVTLTSSAGGAERSTTIRDFVSVNGGVYVWEGTGAIGLRSGRFIADLLEEAGVPVSYSRTAVVHPDLRGYDAVFLSFGPYGPQGTAIPLGISAEPAIRNYLNSGGRVYLEGGDALGFDQEDNTAFWSLFGIEYAEDGSDEAQPVTNLVGQDGSIAAGLSFASSNQINDTWVDSFEPSSSGKAMFVEESYGTTVGVQSQHANGSRTVAMSYTLKDLVDGSSRRADVLQSVLDFFEIAAVVTDTEQLELPGSVTLSPVYPNPFSKTATLAFELSEAGPVRIDVVNALGQQVAVLMDGSVMTAGSHEVNLDGSNLSSGMYFVTLQAGSQVKRTAVVLAR